MPETFVHQNQYLRAVIDAIPSMVFILDSNLKVMDANSAAKAILGKECEVIVKRLCGEVLHCIHQIESEHDCGQTDFCKDCIIKLAITTSNITKGVYRQKYKMIRQVKGVDHEADYVVTASPIIYNDYTLFLLILEDVSELMALRHLATLCSYCTKIQNEEGQWEKVHHYLARKENMVYSHGMCPSCLAEFRPKFKP